MYQEIYGTFFVYIFDYLSSTPSNYTGRVESFTAPVSGKYKMECWGASGASINPNVSYLKPGLGGYSIGYLNAAPNKNFYVCVGSSGAYGAYSYNNNLGYSLRLGSPGGGATHISINSGGELKNFSSHPTDILLVAGGGGGVDIVSGKEASGGYGGGTKGGAGASTDGTNIGTGGTANAGGKTNFQYQGVNGSFGLGGVGWASNNDYAAQGGSGWYGGGGGCTTTVGTAGGGSGHVNSSLLSNAQTIAGNQSFPSPNGGTETGHSGHGECIISQTAF